MQPVSGGTQKVTFNREDDREYEALKRATQAQAASNPYIQGVGAPDSNFSQTDSPGNTPSEATNTSGSAETMRSATTDPQQDQQSFESDALTERLEIMRRGGQKRGLNDQSQTYGA